MVQVSGAGAKAKALEWVAEGLCAWAAFACGVRVGGNCCRRLALKLLTGAQLGLVGELLWVLGLLSKLILVVSASLHAFRPSIMTQATAC